MLAFSARSGQLAARIGPRLQMSAGPLIVAGGLVLMTRSSDAGGYAASVLPGVVLFGIGLAVTVAPLTATAMAAAPAEHSGVASAVNNAVARAAGLVAVAVLPFLAGITGAAALQPHHLASGFRTALIISAGLCAIGGGLALATIRNPNGAGNGTGPKTRDAACAARCLAVATFDTANWTFGEVIDQPRILAIVILDDPMIGGRHGSKSLHVYRPVAKPALPVVALSKESHVRFRCDN